MIFKQLPTMISDLNKLGIALKSLDAMKIGTVGVNAANIEAYRTALKGLSVEQSVFALASKGATEEQIRQILVTNQATASEVEAAMAKAGLTTATKALTQAEMVEMATKNGVAKAEAEALLSKIGIAATEEGQVVVKKQVTLAMLEQAVASGTLTKAESAQIATMLGLNAVETTNIGITNVLTASFTKLWAVITAHPIGAILTAIGAVAVGTIAYINKTNKEAEEALVEAHENAKQALEDTKSSLSDDKAELQSVNSELETTKERLKEISSIGAPTLTEQNELTKLSTANAQLEAQQTLLENNIKLKQKAAALDAKELLGTQVEMEYSNILDNSSITSNTESYNYEDHAKYQASNLKNAYNIYMKALRDGDTKKQALAQELIDASAGDSAVLTSELLEIIESFKYDDGTIIEGYEDLYNEYMGMIYNLQSLTNPDTFLEIAKSVTTGKGIDYEKAISEAYNLAYEGNFDVESLNQDFVKALADAGIDESTIDYIFSLKQQEYQLLVDKINSKYDSSKVQYTYWDGEGKIHHDYEKENSVKADVEKVNQELNEYARENPIEFQLISSYDENFTLLDKYIEEEKKKATNSADYVGDYVENAIQRIYDEAKVKSETFNDETDISTFKDAWSGTTDDVKEKLLDMVKSGEITTKVLESTEEYKTLLDKTSLSAAQVKDEITNLLNATDKLAGASKGMSNLENPYEEFKKNGFVSAETLSGLADSVFGDLDSFNLFEKIVGDPTSTKQKIQKAFDDIAKDYLLHQNTLSALTEENKQKYIANLKQMGITNAEQFVQDFQNIKNEEINVINQAERNYMAYLNSKGKANEISAEQIAKQNGGLIKSLGSAYKSDYDNWCDLLSKKANAYNDFVDALSKSGINYDDSLTTRGNADKYVNQGHSANENAEMYTKAAEADRASYEAEQAKKKLKLDYKKISTSFGGGYSFGSGKSGSGSGGSGSSNSDTKQTVDWISRLLDVLQKKIDATKAKFENLFTLKSKKNNLNTQINQTKALLTATNKAADKYKKQADKVGLSSSLKKKVQSGDYNISNYSSETADKIQKYQDYYDKYKELKQQADELTTDIRNLRTERYQLYIDDAEAKIAKSQAYAELDAGNFKEQNKHLEYQKKQIKEQYKYQIKIAKLNKDSIEVAKLKAELQKELNDLTKQEFDNIANTYDKQIGLNNNKIQAFQDQISLLEAKGQQIGSALYTKQMSLNNVNEKKLIAEREKLIAKLEEIPKNTDDWYEAQDKLFAVDGELTQIQIDNANLQKSINQLKFDRFDDLLAKLNDIVDETDFLIDMLDSDNFFDDNGNMTSDGVTAMGLTAQNYDTYLAIADKYKEQIAELNSAYKSGGVDLETYNDKMREYQQGQQSAIKSANDAKKAVIDYVKQGLDAQNDALAEAIEKQKELLESEKDLKSFQDQLADSNKTIADIQKQINALESDNSEENRKKLQQLKADLANAQKDQEDLLYDRSISDQEDALDQMLKNSQEQAENYLKDSGKVFMDSLTYVNSHTEQVSQNLEKIAKDTGYDISTYITNAWEDGGKAVDSYESILQGNIPNITAQIGLITSAWEATAKAAEDAAAAMVEATRSNYLDYTSIGADNNVNSNSQSSQSNTVSGTSSVLGAASPVTGNIIGGVLTGMQMANKTAIASFISNNKKAPVQGAKYASLNQYLLDNYGGVLSKANEAKLADMLGVKISSRALTGEQGRKDLDKILQALKSAGFSSGGFVNIKDAIRYSGEDGLALVRNDEYILSPKQTDGFLKLSEYAPQLAESLKNMPMPQWNSPNLDIYRNLPIVDRTSSVVNNFDNRVTIEGVATDKIVKDFENVATKQAEKVVSKINNITYVKGVRR